MKLYICFLLSFSLYTQIFAQALVEEQPAQTITHETFLNKPFTLEFDDEEINDSQIADSRVDDFSVDNSQIADADDQIPPHALSEEDISTILFNEYDLGYDAQEEINDISEIAIKPETIQEKADVQANLPILESQEKNIFEAKSPEELFLHSMQNFIFTKTIVSQETLSSSKIAKSQGKLIAEYLKQLNQECNIPIAQARNITRDCIQKKCQDLNLGISNIEKKSLKKLLQTL